MAGSHKYKEAEEAGHLSCSSSNGEVHGRDHQVCNESVRKVILLKPEDKMDANHRTMNSIHR